MMGIIFLDNEKCKLCGCSGLLADKEKGKKWCPKCVGRGLPNSMTVQDYKPKEDEK